MNYSTSTSSTAARKRREEQEALRDAFKFNLIDNGDEDEELLKKKKRATYQPNPEVPILDNLSSRWNKMDSLDQEEISLYLDDRMRGDWKDMSDLEKKSGKFKYLDT